MLKVICASSLIGHPYTGRLKPNEHFMLLTWLKVYWTTTYFDREQWVECDNNKTTLYKRS